MADLFELDAETLATVEFGIDSLIRQLGKECKLVYESEKQICPNCIFDPAANRSSNVYNGVGAKPFSKGKCPVCKGYGYLPASGTTEAIVKFLIDWQPKPWNYIDPNLNIHVPQGLVQTKGFIADMPKAMQAKYIIIDYKNANMSSQRFVKWGDVTPTGNIVKTRYFLCFWERYGD